MKNISDALTLSSLLTAGIGSLSAQSVVRYDLNRNTIDGEASPALAGFMRSAAAWGQLDAGKVGGGNFTLQLRNEGLCQADDEPGSFG
jgi:hypothetical protein